jgi:hypothetical protein
MKMERIVYKAPLRRPVQCAPRRHRVKNTKRYILGNYRACKARNGALVSRFPAQFQHFLAACSTLSPRATTWILARWGLRGQSYDPLASAAATRHVPGTLNSSPTQGFHKEAHQLMEVGFCWKGGFWLELSSPMPLPTAMAITHDIPHADALTNVDPPCCLFNSCYTSIVIVVGLGQCTHPRKWLPSRQSTSWVHLRGLFCQLFAHLITAPAIRGINWRFFTYTPNPIHVNPYAYLTWFRLWVRKFYPRVIHWQSRTEAQLEVCDPPALNPKGRPRIACLTSKLEGLPYGGRPKPSLRPQANVDTISVCREEGHKRTHCPLLANLNTGWIVGPARLSPSPNGQVTTQVFRVHS